MSLPQPDLPLSSETPQQADEISLLDLVITLAKHKMLIAVFTLLATAMAATIAFTLPAIFTANTKVLIPQQSQSGAAALLSQMGGAASLAGGALGLKNPGDQYIAILQSRTVATRLIEQHGLKQRYDAETLDAAINTLYAHTSIKSGKDNILTIAVEDTDPAVAARLANAYVGALEWLSQRLAMTETAQRRLFFEKQLKLSQAQLMDAENAFNAIQKKTGLIALDAQATAILRAGMDLSAQIAAKEVEIAVLRSYATEKNPDYIRTLLQLKTMRAKLQEMEGRTRQKGSNLVPTGRISESGLEYSRGLREVKYQETLYELLAKQYEMARLEEARDGLVIQVLDPALPPTEKSKPQRLLIVTLAAIVGIFMGIFMAFIREAISRRADNPEYAQQWMQLKQHLQIRRQATDTQATTHNEKIKPTSL